MNQGGTLAFDSTGKSTLCPELFGSDSAAQMAGAALPSQPLGTGRQTSAGDGQEGITAGRSVKVNAQKGCFPSSRNYPRRPLQVHAGSRPRALGCILTLSSEVDPGLVAINPTPESYLILRS